jgi:hypothetical protein
VSNDPRQDQAEHGVDRRTAERRAEAQAVRGEGALVRHRRDELIEAHARRLGQHGGERQQHEQAHVEHAVSKREPETGQHSAFLEPEA